MKNIIIIYHFVFIFFSNYKYIKTNKVNKQIININDEINKTDFKFHDIN